MPLYKTQHIDDRRILAIWRIEESEEELYNQVYLSLEDQEFLSKLKKPSRRKEWLTARLLTQAMLEKEVSIVYDEKGKPYIPDSPWNIGITHKNEYVGIILGESKQVALDIEKLSKRVDKVYNYYMHEKELKDVPRNFRNFYLHLVWCAKECLIKVTGRTEASLLKEMYVYPIKEYQKVFFAEIRTGAIWTIYEFEYKRLDEDYIVVWTSDAEGHTNTEDLA